jgi:hypothetical protein
MGKVTTGKRIAINLEFYSRGKTKIPSVTFMEGKEDQGIPFTSHTHVKGTQEGDAFSAFSKAAHEFCKQLIEGGELD